MYFKKANPKQFSTGGIERFQIILLFWKRKIDIAFIKKKKKYIILYVFNSIVVSIARDTIHNIILWFYSQTATYGQ